MLLRKFDACFDPPSLCRFLSEYLILERLFWVNKTYFLIIPGCLYILLISKSNNNNFCSQKWAFFWVYFLSKIWNNPSKSAPNQNFPFSLQTQLCKYKSCKVSASEHEPAKRYWVWNFAFHFQWNIFFLECSEL